MTYWMRANYQPGLPLDGGRERVTAGAAHTSLARQAAREGMVLLKNDGGLLPIPQKTPVAVFGKAQIDYVYGGGGSGEVFAPYLVSVYDGLCQKEKEGKLTLFHELAGFYRTHTLAQYANGALRGEVKEPPIPEDLLRRARGFTDFALITLSRYSEEGDDRTSGEFDGDYHLSRSEADMVEAVRTVFPRVAVVINAGSVMDTSWLAGDSRIQAALYIWQPGMEGGNACADLLCGDANPCGKLCDTFAASIHDYPSTQGYFSSIHHVDYTEDIFVGYRYFETFPQAASRVNYPFGFGLSYTTFALRNSACHTEDTHVHVTVTVENTGSHAGKEVVQLYCSAPQGKLGKPAKVLCAYRKTRLLAPGEAENLCLSFDLRDIASYDDTGKVRKSAYLLEAGTYRFFLGTSVRHGEYLPATLALSDMVIVRQLQPRCVPERLEKRLCADGTYEALPTFPADEQTNTVNEDMEYFDPPLSHCWPETIRQRDRHLFMEVADGKITMEAFLAQLSDDQLISMLGGQPNTGVANTFGIGGPGEFGIPNLMTADGPAGLRIRPECGISTTAWPCASLMACSFSPELAYAVACAAAEEVEENNLSLWLSPGMNIHRNPLCGRNFEYYSEDPYLAGTMAAAVVNGVQTRNCGATPKHFACNNKEFNRKASDSRVSERALREIYLKGFQIMLSLSQPLAIMSSYNLLNGCNTSQRGDLLTGILREEWGYQGLVISDWWNSADHLQELKAGNDVKMPIGNEVQLKAALADGTLTRAEILVSVRRILGFALKLR